MSSAARAEWSIFGLSFQGNIAGGVTLQVPSPELDRARELLTDVESDRSISEPAEE